ncbi:MAG: ribonuclease III [Candidatus Glassbacteria bacterium]
MLAWPFRIVRNLFTSGRTRKDREKKLSRLEQSMSYSFRNKKLLETALSHLSYVNETGGNYQDSNERLEFLGDAVLDLIVSEYLFSRFNSAREGKLTRIKSAIVSRSALAARADRFHLDEFVIFSRDSFADLKRGRKSVISNSLEAIIGAIYLDGGLSAARRFVYGKLLDSGKTELGLDSLDEAKNTLLHLTQVNFHCQPSYRIVKITGPEHAREFICEVKIKERIMGRGAGPSKKEAEKKAAVQTLEQLSEMDNIEYDNETSE